MINATTVTLSNTQEGAQAPCLPHTTANTENAPHLSSVAGNAITLALKTARHHNLIQEGGGT